MDRIARVRSCLEGKMTDRPPFSFWQHMRAGEELGQPCIDAHIRLYRNTGIDMVKMMIDGYRDVSEGLKIEKPSDWRSVRFPSVKSPFITGQLDRIKGVMDAIGSEAAVFYHSFTPFRHCLKINFTSQEKHSMLISWIMRQRKEYGIFCLCLMKGSGGCIWRTRQRQ